MRIYPGPLHDGGLLVDYDLMSNLPGLFVLGEANFSDHGANRLGASALMQGLADGYFVIPYTIGHFFATTKLAKVGPDHAEFKRVLAEVDARTKKLLAIKGKRTVDSFHKELGKLMWEHVGMAREKAGLEKVLQKIPALRQQFWDDVFVPGSGEELNQSSKAGRVADFLEFAGF
jgi:succinate dehydrogenase / fumarate reductase flavoprotein subunit